MDSLNLKLKVFLSIVFLQIITLNLHSSEKTTIPSKVRLINKPIIISEEKENLSIEGLGPTWLFNVPTADILHKNNYNSGILYLDVGLTKDNDLEVGLHGIKYQLIKGKEKEAALSIGVSLFSGLYPYVVLSQWMEDDIRIHYGFYPFPYFVFGAIEVPIDDSVKGIFEIKDGFGLGIRYKLDKQWNFDFGFGFSFYANRILVPDFLNFDSFAYKFGTGLKPFIIISACYLGSI